MLCLANSRSVRSSAVDVRPIRSRGRDGTDTCGRSGFVVHGGNFAKFNSSEGCIILKLEALQTLNDYGGGVLKVVACKPGTACTPEVCDRDPTLCLPNGVPPVDNPTYVPAGSGNDCHPVPSSCYPVP